MTLLDCLLKSRESRDGKTIRQSRLRRRRCPAVESVPEEVSRAWVLRGTRIPVSVIFENLEAGANIDGIMEWFEELDREQIKAVIEFAARPV